MANDSAHPDHLKRTAHRNDLGVDVTARIPAEADGWITLDDELAALWADARQHLRVRSNDAHTLYATAIAHSLLDMLPDADRSVVLPAILLHDIGWSTLPEDEVLTAIAPGGGRPELVRHHEIEGARMARELLAKHGFAPERTERIVEIIDGHDSRLEAISLDDAIVKDSDKVWRLTPHGIDTIMDWFGLERGAAVRLCCTRVHAQLFTEPARAVARALAALESANLWPQREALRGGSE